MKFKVGDIVRGTRADRYTITNDKMTKGKVGEVFPVESRHFELVSPRPSTKSDLKTGMRVFTENKDEYVVMMDTVHGDILLNMPDKRGWEPLKHYNDDLAHRKYHEFDIASINVPKLSAHTLRDFNKEDFELVWKREEKPIEITIEEIAELKGVSPERIRIKKAE